MTKLVTMHQIFSHCDSDYVNHCEIFPETKLPYMYGYNEHLSQSQFPLQPQPTSPDKTIMKQLWAPWRMDFIERDKPSGCVFCLAAASKNDKENLVVHREKDCFVILNKYPYNNGHLMIVPYLHTNDFSRMPKAIAGAMVELAQSCISRLENFYAPGGFNLGMNLGEAAGAGIRDHLHLHIVPRWIGDTNFMPVLADTKSMPQHLYRSYDILKEAWRLS